MVKTFRDLISEHSVFFWGIAKLRKLKLKLRCYCPWFFSTHWNLNEHFNLCRKFCGFIHTVWKSLKKVLFYNIASLIIWIFAPKYSSSQQGFNVMDHNGVEKSHETFFVNFETPCFDEHYKMTLVVIDTLKKKNSWKVHLKILFRFLNSLVRFYCLHICLIICAKSNEIFSAVIFSSNSGTCTNTALPDIICKLLQ